MTLPILVTGAAGRTGAVGKLLVERLRAQGAPVRAAVRQRDDRSAALEAMGAEVVVADLSRTEELVPLCAGCSRVYFGMGIADNYLAATVAIGAALKAQGGTEILINMSQMTVSEMSLTAMTASPQQRLHWLAEQALNWSGLPVVHLRPTVFLEGFFLQLVRRGVKKHDELQLPFGDGRTSPISAEDVARVAAEILLRPQGHAGKIYDLTGEKSQDLHGVAEEYGRALGRPVRYKDIDFEQWKAEIDDLPIPPHLANHLLTMGRLHADNRYDRLTSTVKDLTGEPPLGIEAFARKYAKAFASSAATAA